MAYAESIVFGRWKQYQEDLAGVLPDDEWLYF